MNPATAESEKLLLLEWKAIAGLSAIFSLRMFGLFMLLPVLVLYAPDLPASSPLLIGVALGVYGLTQALLQIPMGLLSDRIDRKKVIALGLLIFAFGSVIAAMADSIFGLIFGRALQGTGAISAAILALTADLTRSSQRTKAMALIGVSIGVSFMLAMTLAPILVAMIDLCGLFYLMAVLALCAIIVLYKVVPNAESSRVPSGQGRHLPIVKDLKQVIANRQLLSLNVGIMLSHSILIALFLVIPQQFVAYGFAPEQHWKLYIAILLASIPAMLPFIAMGSKQAGIVKSYKIAVLVVVLAFVVSLLPLDWGIGQASLVLVLFFGGFNALESLLPSLLSQVSSARLRGSATSVYSTFQFSGIFIGGVAGGWVIEQFGESAINWFCLLLAVIWLVLAWLPIRFRLTASKTIDISQFDLSHKQELIDRIGRLSGVREVTIVDGGAVAFLEVDENVYNDFDIEQLMSGH